MELPRRSISDLVTRYELEPELRDLYVEGVFDKEVLSAGLLNLGGAGRIVYEIDTVEVGNEILIKHGLTSGNKQRVIALAKELSETELKSDYRCLVDRDLDHWFGPLEVIPKLEWTRYCSLELYLLTDEVLHSVLVVMAKSKISKWAEFVESFKVALTKVYAARLADRELSLNLSWIELEKVLSVKQGEVEFDLGAFVDRVINKSQRHESKKAFIESIQVWMGKLEGDSRLFIRGHDFVEMLAWSVRANKGIKEFSSSETIQRLFVYLASKDNEVLELVR